MVLFSLFSHFLVIFIEKMIDLYTNDDDRKREYVRNCMLVYNQALENTFKKHTTAVKPLNIQHLLTY
jgi:hypothetical protein